MTVTETETETEMEMGTEMEMETETETEMGMEMGTEMGTEMETGTEMAIARTNPTRPISSLKTRIATGLTALRLNLSSSTRWPTPEWRTGAR